MGLMGRGMGAMGFGPMGGISGIRGRIRRLPAGVGGMGGMDGYGGGFGGEEEDGGIGGMPRMLPGGGESRVGGSKKKNCREAWAWWAGGGDGGDGCRERIREMLQQRRRGQMPSGGILDGLVGGMGGIRGAGSMAGGGILGRGRTYMPGGGNLRGGYGEAYCENSADSSGGGGESGGEDEEGHDGCVCGIEHDSGYNSSGDEKDSHPSAKG